MGLGTRRGARLSVETCRKRGEGGSNEGKGGRGGRQDEQVRESGQRGGSFVLSPRERLSHHNIPCPRPTFFRPRACLCAEAERSGQLLFTPPRFRKQKRLLWFFRQCSERSKSLLGLRDTTLLASASLLRRALCSSSSSTHPHQRRLPSAACQSASPRSVGFRCSRSVAPDRTVE